MKDAVDHLTEALEAAYLEHAEGPDGAHDVHHARRVWTNARRIAEEEGTGDLRIIAAAAYLHDLVNLRKDAPDRHRASAQSGAKASRVLAELGFSEEEIEGARHAIRSHSYSAGIPPETPEARIVQDADRLESLGALGLARAFHVGGVLGRGLLDGEDPFARRRPLDEVAYSLDHFQSKLLKLPEKFQTASGRRMALERARVLQDFLQTLRTELMVE
ncbi:MAG: HD domain-containing protein [Pseudomonadota bacterium]